MADFTNNQIRNTYQRVLQVHGDEVQDGLGGILTGSLNVSASLNMLGTSSFTTNGAVTLGDTLDVTGETNLNSNTTVTGNLTVTQDITARSIISQLTQSTILYRSGSTKFGDTYDDTHEFTGSVQISGSAKLIGNQNLTGSLNHSGSATAEGTYEIKEGAYGAFFANPQTFERDLTIPASYNSRIFGPITVSAGKTLTVSANAKLSIIDL